jgi:hypothetical protein
MHNVYSTRLGWPLWNICVTNVHGYVPFVSTSRSFPHSWPITGFVTRSIRRVPLVEQEFLTIPEHLRWPTKWWLQHKKNRNFITRSKYCRCWILEIYIIKILKIKMNEILSNISCRLWLSELSIIDFNATFKSRYLVTKNDELLYPTH